jgi:hypothetical protein
MKALVPILCIALLCSAAIAPSPAKAAYDIQVVLVVKGLNDTGFARLTKEAAHDAAASLEYACLRSGVVVLQFNGAASGDRADAIALAARLLAAAGLERAMEVVHVYIEASGPGKC